MCSYKYNDKVIVSFEQRMRNLKFSLLHVYSRESKYIFEGTCKKLLQYIMMRLLFI